MNFLHELSFDLSNELLCKTPVEKIMGFILVIHTPDLCAAPQATSSSGCANHHQAGVLITHT